jgi:hypothetical protein
MAESTAGSTEGKESDYLSDYQRLKKKGLRSKNLLRNTTNKQTNNALLRQLPLYALYSTPFGVNDTRHTTNKWKSKVNNTQLNNTIIHKIYKLRQVTHGNVHLLPVFHHRNKWTNIWCPAQCRLTVLISVIIPAEVINFSLGVTCARLSISDLQTLIYLPRHTYDTPDYHNHRYMPSFTSQHILGFVNCAIKSTKLHHV